MNIITLDHINKSYTGRLLFSDASFYLQEGEKVGILGVNGTGKSTLLRMIAGLEEPDSGKVVRANNLTVEMLGQNPEFNPGETVLEAVMRSHEESEKSEIQAKAKSMLNKLGIFTFDDPVENLSGGQRKKVALVRVLLHRSDVLLLDEPTNHLDAEMSGWLEEFLRSYRGTLVMVTHDRYFLDSVANRIVEIDKGEIYSYDTNYSGFLERKAQREEIMQATERKRQSLLRTELEWVRRGARARTTKQKARLERYEELKNKTAPVTDAQVQMSSVSSRMGKTTVELHGLGKAYGDKVLFQDFTYMFLRGDRVGFVGENGCGKTTLMKMIAATAGQESVQPDQGSIVIGQTIRLGYFSQEISFGKEEGASYMDPDQRVIDYIKDIAEFLETPEGKVSAARMCERFLFDSEQQYSLIGKLSGGQRRRLYLLRVLMGAPNVLILDEPTNDLDIRTLTILEDYLDSFEGIVITVSHDRYFLDRCVRRIFAFEGDGVIKQYEGGYSDYRLRWEVENQLLAETNFSKEKKSVPSEVAGSSKRGKPDSVKVHKKRLTYMEQKEYDTIEEDIAGLEEKLDALEGEIVKHARDFVKLNDLTKEKEKVQEQLDQKMERWMYLEELVAEIQQEAENGKRN